MGDRLNQAAQRVDAEGLRGEVSQSLEKARAEQREFAISRVRKKIVDREAPRFRTKPKLRKGRIAGILALAAAIPLASWFAKDQHDRHQAALAAAQSTPLTFSVQGTSGEVGQFLAAPPSEPIPIAFSDGSEVDLAPRARARVASLGAKGARVLVESGTVHVAVIHKEQT